MVLAALGMTGGREDGEKTQDGFLAALGMTEGFLVPMNRDSQEPLVASLLEMTEQDKRDSSLRKAERWGGGLRPESARRGSSARYA